MVWTVSCGGVMPINRATHFEARSCAHSRTSQPTDIQDVPNSAERVKGPVPLYHRMRWSYSLSRKMAKYEEESELQMVQVPCKILRC